MDHPDGANAAARLLPTGAAPSARLTAPRFIVFLLIFAAFGFAVYANSLTNTALFHHVSGAVEDPVLDNTMLHSVPLLGKIFTGEFLLASGGRYCPLGYALFAATNLAMPRGTVVGWHIVLIALEVVTAMVIFLGLRMLTGERAAALLAAVYLAHPVFAPLVNNVNMIYALWGMLFTATALWLYLRYLVTESRRALVLSTAAFAAAAFTFAYAMLAPAVMVALYLFHEARPRLAVVVATALVAGAAVERLCGASPVIILASANGLMLVVALSTRTGRKGFGRMLASLAPAIVVAAAYLGVALWVHAPSIFVLGRERLTLPVAPRFVLYLNLQASKAQMAALALGALSPLLLFLKAGARHALLVFAAFFCALTTACASVDYSTDVTYWQTVNARRAGDPLVELNLASAYLDVGKAAEARDLLIHLRYDPVAAAAPGRGSYDAETLDLVQLAVLNKLGRAYAALGDEKTAGFYMFPRTLALQTRIRKNRLMEIGDFCLKTGYISWAENHYASCLVMDPYDVRVYNGLGKCMMYKNFFRAAQELFAHVLYLDQGNPTALYYLAFIARVSGDDRAFDSYSRAWRSATGSAGDVDFAPVYDAFKFDRDTMRNWFTGDPLDLMRFIGDKEAYKIDYQGKTYEFSEAPLDVGRYFMKRGNLDKAREFLQAALDANSKSVGALRDLIEVSKLSNHPDDAARFTALLEAATK